MTVINKEFDYLYEIVYWLMGKRTRIHDEYNLSGARYSSKTFSIAFVVATIIAISIKLKKKVAFYLFRKLNKDINELTKEIYQALIDIGFIDGKDFTLNYPNKQANFRFKSTKSYIRVMGIYSNSNDRIPLKGLSRSEVKGFNLAISWREEANEITHSEKYAIRFAIGKVDKIIEISSCNPDSLNQEHIAYLNDVMPFNLEIMQSKNEQIGSFYINGKYILNHYTNWKVNQNNLSSGIIANLEELKILDPVKARSWYDGVPSIIEGAIFARYLDQCGTKLDFNVREICGGLDLGYSTSPSGHPTTASLWFIGENERLRRCHKESEYFHCNATTETYKGFTFKDSELIANEIINYYCNEARLYPAMYFNFNCYVDYGNGGIVMIDLLNKLTRNINIKWLKFIKVDKEIMKLNDRIEFTTTAMIKGIMSFNWERCPWTRKQYSLVQWLNNSKKPPSANMLPQMLDLHDDTWDSDCGALFHKMVWLMQGINYLLLSKQWQERLRKNV